MRVAGIDYSTRAVDIVTVDQDTRKPLWTRYELQGADAFDRTRDIGAVVPGRGSEFWDDIVGVGIEEPAGQQRHVMTRVQGAILSRIPSWLMVRPFVPAEWRTIAGMPGNASKESVSLYARLSQPEDFEWPQDAYDALCIALATQTLLEREAAA